MPWASTERTDEFYTPFSVGPVMQVSPALPNAAPATIAASGTYDVGNIIADGYKVLAIGATLSNAGSIVVQRYLDLASTVVQGAALTQALVAGAAGVINVNDGLPFATFDAKVVNSGASVATLTNFGILLNAG